MALVFSSNIGYASIYEIAHKFQTHSSEQNSGTVDHYKQFKLASESLITEAAVYQNPELLPLTSDNDLMFYGGFNYASSYVSNATSAASIFWQHASFHKNYIREILFPFHSFW